MTDHDRDTDRDTDCAPLRRAIVLGGSFTGLLAARVLSDHFDDVVVLERDIPADEPAPRKGTPHALHPHGLLAGGLQALEELFPGFTDAMRARGALTADLLADVGFYVAGRALADGGRAGSLTLCASRLAIEHELRARVRRLPNVRLRFGVTFGAPLLDSAGHGVAALPVIEVDAAHPSAYLFGALVVDCTGRGSQLPAWLRRWGFGEVPQDRVNAKVCYVSAYLRRRGSLALGQGVAKPLLAASATPDSPRPAVLIAQEPDCNGQPRWVVAVGGYSGDFPVATLEGLRRRAHELGIPDLARAVREGEPLGLPLRYVFPYSYRRRYERMERFPQRLLPMGDALASINPIYGQGMTMAALQALALSRELERGAADLTRRYFEAARRIVGTAWTITVGGDLALDAVPGHRAWPVRAMNAYLTRVRRAAARSAIVSLALQRVLHLLASPLSLLRPAVAWRVALYGAAPASVPRTERGVGAAVVPSGANRVAGSATTLRREPMRSG